MKKMWLGLILVGSILTAPAADVTALSSPEANFEYLWQALDVNYALFHAKHIDWPAVYRVFRPMVTARTTDDELFDIMCKAIGFLNDNHVRLLSMEPTRYFSTGFLQDYFGSAGQELRRSLMRERPVPAVYFKQELKESENKIFAYGWLENGIGYLHFRNFTDNEGSEKAIDQIISEFQDARGLIVDVRRNGGGDDQIGKMLACRFADRKRLYMTTRERNGARYDDFDPPRHFFVEPQGPRQFTKPIVLLINRLSISAAEGFSLAMRILPHVTLIGDFTSGCFADNYNLRLPNGWNLSLSKNYFLDYTGFCWEGIGVPPDLKITDDYSTAVRSQDKVLETALAFLVRGQLGPQDPQAGLQRCESLTDALARDLEKLDLKAALDLAGQRATAAEQNGFYCDQEELIGLGRRLFAAREFGKGERVFALVGQLFPKSAQAYRLIGLEHWKTGMKKEAASALQNALSLRPSGMSPLAISFGEYLTERLLIGMILEGNTGFAHEFDRLRIQFPAQVGENTLNDLGYILLRSEMVREAVAAFSFCYERFPQSWNACDSLAEAYMKAGDKKQAIRFYEKTLKMHPDNPNAVSQLQKLKRTENP